MSHLRLIVAAALALVLVLPATALAATFDVGGTVTNTDGSPAAGAEITILVQGTDQIVATTTDENGAWTLQVDAEPGAVLEVERHRASPRAPSPTRTAASPRRRRAARQCHDPGGGPTSRDRLPARQPAHRDGLRDPPRLPTPAVATAAAARRGAPEQQPDTAGVTPPSTDTLPVARSGTTAGNAAFLVLGVLVGLTGTVLVLTDRRRADRARLGRPRPRSSPRRA